MKFSGSAVAAAVNGHLELPPGVDDVIVSAVSIDSRSITEGSLFVPVVAERDGHDFIEAAIENGAAAHFRSAGQSNSEFVSAGVPVIVVDDTALALARLGVAARSRLGDRVIGVTGSVGKTSVKDLLAAAASTTYVTAASHKSFNNELGVPLTLANAPDGTEAAVIEMGARGRGHIAELCAVARPTVGVVTLVGAAHTELFGTVDDVAEAKGELVEALPAEGTAVLNADQPLVRAMADRTDATVLTFGRSSGEVTAEAVTLDDELRPRFDLVSPWGRAEIRLEVRGEHNVANALAAAAGALAIGVPLESVATGLAAADLSPWRMELTRTSTGARVLNDAYNANPMSMRAAIDAFVALPAQRHVAVLGLMAELGDRARRDHRDVADYAERVGVEVLAFETELYGRPTVTGVAGAVDELGPLDGETAVLVKGSRIAGLERLARVLTE